MGVKLEFVDVRKFTFLFPFKWILQREIEGMEAGSIVIIDETLRIMMYMINVGSMDVQMKLINLVSACYFIVPN